MLLHAALGASSAYRWMACPGSPREIAKLPDALREKTSKYAAEGTVAHGLLERAFAGEDISLLEGTTVEYRERGQEFDIDITTEMIEAVMLGKEVGESEQARLPGSQLKIEERVFPLPDRPDMFGTSDMIITQRWGELVVVDYKHGVGHVVDVEDNSQLLYYGLGALMAAGGPAEYSKVTLIIVQPRREHEKGRVRRWTIEPQDLVEFADTLRAAAARCDDPNAPVIAGQHCGWCPAKALCGEFRLMLRNELGAVFDANPPVDMKPRLPDERDGAAIARAAKIIPLLDEWIRAVRGMQQRYLEAGYGMEGWKLVQGKTNRKYVDEETAKARLRELLAAVQGVPVDQVDDSDLYAPRKLRSPAQIEELRQPLAPGEKRAKHVVPGRNGDERRAWVSRLTMNPPGRLTVVPDSDERDAVVPARAIEIFEAAQQGAALPAPPSKVELIF